jgi:hypothetical protein
MTVPDLPLSEASVCCLPSASGSVKSGATAPTASPAGLAPAATVDGATEAAAANSDESARSATAKSFFIFLPQLLIDVGWPGSDDRVADRRAKFKEGSA